MMFPINCEYFYLGCVLVDLDAFERLMSVFCVTRMFNPAGDHWAEFGPRDQCKSCAGRNSAGFGMTL